MARMHSWLGWLSCVAGLWVLISPWLFAWEVCPAVYGSNIAPGAIAAILGAVVGVSARTKTA